jgi:hypothetical protein
MFLCWYRHPVSQPTQYDGTTPWKDYEAHFESVALVNDWNAEECGVFLAVSLRGLAQGVLRDLPPGQRQNYFSLKAALQQQFGMEDQAELAKVHLKTRVRGKDESLQELSQALRRLATQAYPGADRYMHEMLALDSFKDCLDADVRMMVNQATPRSINEALRIATEFEAYKLAEKQRGQGRYARRVFRDGEDPHDLEDGEEKLSLTRGDMLNIAREVARILEPRGNGSLLGTRPRTQQ